MGANLSECFFRFVKISRVGYKSSMGLGHGGWASFKGEY